MFGVNNSYLADGDGQTSSPIEKQPDMTNNLGRATAYEDLC